MVVGDSGLHNLLRGVSYVVFSKRFVINNLLSILFVLWRPTDTDWSSVGVGRQLCLLKL